MSVSDVTERHMTIYAVTAKDDFGEPCIIALTVDKARAEYLAEAYAANIKEFEDGKSAFAPPVWEYKESASQHNNETTTHCRSLGLSYHSPEQVFKYNKTKDVKCISAFVIAEDENQARIKAHKMIAEYRAGK